jgi:predicted nucleic-acid-binding protein
MLAIDTNVVVRYLTGDHPDQAPRARALVDGQAVFVPVTVVLEVEWVLRSAYGYPADQVARALQAFAGLPTVTMEDAEIVAGALDATLLGMDFADALHLGKSAGCDGFASFDRRLIKAAQASGGYSVREA